MNSPSGRSPAAVKGEADEELAGLLRTICETPAPTFEEGERARLIASLLETAGLSPRVDGVGNVVAEVPGGDGPHVLLAAHLDTVFAAATDVTVRIDGDRWSAPGVGDNSASLAVLVHLLLARSRGESLRLPRLTVAATVGEEGLGDLRGIRALFEGDGGRFDAVVAIDGHLGTVVDTAVGSRRFEVEVTARGGHSWGDFPSPSAVHAVAAMVAALQGLDTPKEPRSSYNVGQLWGGTGVNAIAQNAGFNLDLRSVDDSVLERLEKDAMAIVRKIARRQRVEASTERVGDRPASAGKANRELVRAAREALAEEGVDSRTTASSTDANVPMALGVPAISFGVYRGGDAHRLSEWLDFPSLAVGYRSLARLLQRMAGWDS